MTIPPSSDRYGHDILASDPHLREERRRRPTSERITAEPGLLIEDVQYIQGTYREEYIKAYTIAFITRIKEVKEHQQYVNISLDLQEVQNAVALLLDQEKQAGEEDGFDSAFFHIYKIISLYTTFILEEPVHPVGTPFPGGLKVQYDGEKFLCPVKERQKDNPGAVCGFCIAQQDPETM